MNEFLIIQNNALGSLALHAFCKTYYNAKDKTEGPSLSLLMPVLPLVFNKRSCDALSAIKKVTRQRFFSILSEHREIPVGLQHRMELMADQTFEALNVAFKKKLLHFNPENSQIVPASRVTTPAFTYHDNQNILIAARVLGNWFSIYPVEQLCISLNIHF
jgi:hypothetical protein